MRIALCLAVASLFLAEEGPAQTYPGRFISYRTEGKSVTVTADSASVRFTFYKPDILRVDYLPGASSSPDTSFVVVQDTTENVAFSVTLDRVPLFVSAGSILPMAPVMNFSDERPLDTLELHLYPPSDSWKSFTLYEDDEASAPAIRTFVLPLLPYFGVKALCLESEVSTFLQLQARASPIGRKTDGSNYTIQI